jgi:two-component system CheB/CheR fusion protein
VPVIFVVDDDSHIREGLRRQLEDDGHTVRDYASCEDFLDSYRPGSGGCLLVDAYLPGMHGIDLLRQLRERGDTMPAIMITGDSDVGTAVQALKAGAVDFIEKPVGAAELRISVARALDQSRDGSQRAAWHKEAVGHLAGLTARQREVMAMVLAGHPSKNIAADLGISQRTVENHRASIMAKTGARSLPALARIGVAAEG